MLCRFNLSFESRDRQLRWRPASLSLALHAGHTAIRWTAIDVDAVLTLPLTDQLDSLLDDVIARSFKANPLLSPSLVPPEPWTQVRKGGLPADHWANVPLIREHHPEITVILASGYSDKAAVATE